jgi:hypothetical protein
LRIVRIRRLGSEREGITRTEATNFLLGIGSSVA